MGIFVIELAVARPPQEPIVLPPRDMPPAMPPNDEKLLLQALEQRFLQAVQEVYGRDGGFDDKLIAVDLADLPACEDWQSNT